MKNYIMMPSVDLYPGIRVDKYTVLEYKSDSVEQKVEALTLHTVTRVVGNGYKSVYDTTVELQEGDILVFDEHRGYIKPVESVSTIKAAIETLRNIESLGE